MANNAPAYTPTFAPLPSGDTTGVTDRTNLNAAWTKAAAGNGRLFIKKGSAAYIVDAGVTMLSHVHVEFEPGAIIKQRDRVVAAATWGTGSNILSMSNTGGIAVGMLVSDPTMNLSANNAFGAIPWACFVTAITPNVSVTITFNPTTTQASPANLNFHPTTNCLRGANITDWSLRCPGGWATLDGNMSECYPYVVNSFDDTNRNGMQLVGCTDYVVDGIEGYNAFYHGCIAVANMDNGRWLRWRGRNCGFRALHFHGEAISGNTTPPQTSNYFAYVESQSSGLKAFRTRGGSENNTGVFVVYDNSRNTNIDTVVGKDNRGPSLMLAGGINLFVGDYASKYAKVGFVDSQDSGMGIQFGAQMNFAHINHLSAHGTSGKMLNCSFPSTASALDYYVTAAGVVTSLKTRTIDIPVGAIALYGLREAMRVFCTGVTSWPSYGNVIWKTSVGTGAGGTDQLIVFEQDNPTSDPWTAGPFTADLYFRTCNDAAINFAAGAGEVIENIVFGSVSTEKAGRYGILSTYNGSQVRHKNIRFGDVILKGCSQYGMYIGSMSNFNFDSLLQHNCGSGRDVGTVSGSAESFLLSCDTFTINEFGTRQDAGIFTNNNQAIQTDSVCRNGTIRARALRKPAAGAVMNIATVTGAGNSSTGASGPIILDNPTASDGTRLVAGSGTAQILLVDSTACVITRPEAGAFCPTLPTAISVTSSPFTYQNTSANKQNVLVAIGTVSDISFSRDNVTFYPVGIVAGDILLNPSDYLKVTYAVAPTMTAVPI